MVVLTVCSPALGFFAAWSRSLLFALPWRPDTPWALLWGSSSVNSCSMKSVNSWHSSSSLLKSWLRVISNGNTQRKCLRFRNFWNLYSCNPWPGVSDSLLRALKLIFIFLDGFTTPSPFSLSIYFCPSALLLGEKKKSNSWYLWWIISSKGFPAISVVKNPSATRETWVWSLGWEDTPEKGKTTHSSILAWRIPWTYSPWGRKELDTTERLVLPYILPKWPHDLASNDSGLACSSSYQAIEPHHLGAWQVFKAGPTVEDGGSDMWESES